MAEHLAQLTALLAQQPAMSALVAELRQGGLIHVAGVRKATMAPLVSMLATQQSGPQVVVVATTEDARRLSEDIAVWAPHQRVTQFVANDAIPYEPMTASMDATTARLATVRLLQQRADVVVVVPVRALLQATIAPADLQ